MSCDNECVVNNCSGGVTGMTVIEYWKTHNCPTAYEQMINTNPDGFLEYNPDQQLIVQDYINNLFNWYLINYDITDDVNSDRYNDFQNTLLDTCLDRSLPGICDSFLTNYCGQFNREQVISSEVLTNFCGCYVNPDPTYLQYTLANENCYYGLTGCQSGCTAGEAGCTGQPSCDPICRQAKTVHRANQEFGTVIGCPQNICVISNVVLDIQNSTVPGGVNFNGICGGCNDTQGCLCILDGINISETASSVGLGNNFSQFCSGSSVCLINGAISNCQDVNSNNIPIDGMSFLPNISILIIFIVIIILVAILIFAMHYDRSQKKK